MKHTFFSILFVITMISNSTAAEDWGRTGHRVTGEIAEMHLSKKAKKAISKLLDGQSLALVSTYADEIKSDPLYKSYRPWHYVNFPFNATYNQHPKSEKGDIIMGIEKCISILKDENSTKDEKAFHLKLLVHFLGDLHQPLHIGIAEDRGGNNFQVQWFDKGTNLHSVWDTKMIEEFEMSYSELSSNREKISKEDLELIKLGTPIEWMNESRAICKNIYANTKVGENLGYRYMYDYFEVVRNQLQKGGIRLSVILNDIFEAY